MGNSATDLSIKAYTHTVKRGKNKTEAKEGVCEYTRHENVNPQDTPVSHYTHKASVVRKPNLATAGAVPSSVVSKCRNNDPATAGITKKVGK